LTKNRERFTPQAACETAPGCYNHPLMMNRPTLRFWWAAGLLAVALAAGCSVGDFVLRHTANITDAPDVEVVRLPPVFQLDPPAGAVALPTQWVLASSTTAGLIPGGDEPARFDLSPFLARDPWVGSWSSALPTEQKIFVQPAELKRVELEAGDWRERYVIQLAENPGPEVRRGTEENARLAFDDVARVLCPTGVTRRMLGSSPTDAVYESRFTKCPRFGSDRVVLTRELFGNWDTLRHSQAIYAFSYEVRGAQFTAAQRAAGLKLIEAPDLQMATWDGDKHPLWRDARLRLVTRE
jgi:hypothetical protein